MNLNDEPPLPEPMAITDSAGDLDDGPRRGLARPADIEREWDAELANAGATRLDGFERAIVFAVLEIERVKAEPG